MKPIYFYGIWLFLLNYIGRLYRDNLNTNYNYMLLCANIYAQYLKCVKTDLKK